MVAIEPCPTIESGPGWVVTGCFSSFSVDVWQLKLAGLQTPLEVTGNHPIFSEDGHDFISASMLRPGERLRTLDGTATVEFIAKKPGRWEVFNLEIHSAHQYDASGINVLVHNAGPNGVNGVVTPPTIESPIQTPIDPAIPGRPDPAWSIDTSTFSEGDKTANGGIRNNAEFWNQWTKLHPDSISASNSFRIQELGLSPKIDQTWLGSFPEHAGNVGETLIHHHVNQGPIAIPVPASTHVGFGPPWH